MIRFSSLVIFIIISHCIFAQDVLPPEQALTGPGGMEYSHDSVAMFDYAPQSDGFWLFEPESPKPDSAHVIVFIHGYGAINPMIYGKWIRHLVRKGNIVIYPRYQRNLVSPSSKKFVERTLDGIHAALDTLKGENHIKPIVSDFSLVGHSYGGVICANLAVNYKPYELPKPVATMLVSPGTGPFKGALLKSYEGMPSDLNLLVMVSDRDRTVGDKIGKRIYNTAIHTSNRNLIRQYSDYYGETPLTSGHDESYAIDKAFDIGLKNFSTKRALKIGHLNAIDFFGYWKLFDALLDYSRSGIHKDYAFGNTPQQRFLGLWSDGKPIKELEITVPKTEKELSELK